MAPAASLTSLSTSGALVATVLASVLVRASVSPNTELATEAVCWTILAIGQWLGSGTRRARHGASADRSGTKRQRHASAQRVVVAAVVAGALSRAVTDTRFIAPLLVPIIVAMRLQGRQTFGRATLNSTSTSSASTSQAQTSHRHEIYRHIAMGVWCFALLLSVQRLGILDIPSAMVLGTATVVLATYLNGMSQRRPGSDRDDEKLATTSFGGGIGRSRAADLIMPAAGALALSMLTAVALTTFIGWTQLRGMLTVILLGGLCKAAWWVAMMQLARDSPWESSLGVESLTLSWFQSLNGPPYLACMFATATASITALLQLDRLLPAPRILRYLPLFVVICVLVPLPGLLKSRDFDNLRLERHPAEQLHDAATESFNGLLQRQSSTLKDAIAEYRRRYSRSPPLGFDKWFEYARAKGSPIIDDFDTIDDGIRPLWRYSADHFNRTTSVAAQWNLNVVRCGIVAGNFTTGDCGKFGERIAELLDEVKHQLPDVMFAVNLLDEPAIMPLTQPDALGMTSFWKLISGGPAMDAVSEACQGKPPTGQRFPLPPMDTHGLPFVTDIMAAKDICQHPEYGTLHGFLVAPSTFAYTRHLFPLLSRASPHPFADILFPSPHYAREGEMYNTADDVAWEDKVNALYWAGRATGVRVTGDSWRHGHRQRLVTLGERPPYKYLTGPSSSSLSSSTAAEWTPFESSSLDSWLFNTHMSELVQCSPLACLAQARALKPSQYLLPSDSPTAPYRHRLALDIDGNSYSGRFYRLLASGSLTLKATLFREWHDDRLVPWFHYVPVGVGLGELPELVRFLTRTERGRELARKIAGNGREWHQRALRRADMSVYMYRLVLELARLLDPTRMAGETDGVAGGFGEA